MKSNHVIHTCAFKWACLFTIITIIALVVSLRRNGERQCHSADIPQLVHANKYRARNQLQLPSEWPMKLWHPTNASMFFLYSKRPKNVILAVIWKIAIDTPSRYGAFTVMHSTAFYSTVLWTSHERLDKQLVQGCQACTSKRDSYPIDKSNNGNTSSYLLMINP